MLNRGGQRYVDVIGIFHRLRPRPAQEWGKLGKQLSMSILLLFSLTVDAM